MKYGEYVKNNGGSIKSEEIEVCDEVVEFKELVVWYTQLLLNNDFIQDVEHIKGAVLLWEQEVYCGVFFGLEYLRQCKTYWEVEEEE